MAFATHSVVSAVLDALSHFMGRELGEGRQVHLDGIGYFRPTLTCTEPVKVDTKRKSTKVKLKSITFRPDMALRSEVGNIKVLPLKQRNVLLLHDCEARDSQLWTNQNNECKDKEKAM